ncbi:MAG: hypothetical protein U0992_02620 [Planctomycetaceae bacterium]
MKVARPAVQLALAGRPNQQHAATAAAVEAVCGVRPAIACR